ncbi:MAG: hypothetical protein WA941_21815 [Nitrososphaeraceae archaeon]
MNAEEAKALLKDRGVSVVNMPHGYIVTVSRRAVRHAVSKWMKWTRS